MVDRAGVGPHGRSRKYLQLRLWLKVWRDGSGRKADCSRQPVDIFTVHLDRLLLDLRSDFVHGGQRWRANTTHFSTSTREQGSKAEKTRDAGEATR